ncbi:toll/interleukin-1 receptor domain-containing protein [Azospirillum argentinense]
MSVYKLGILGTPPDGVGATLTNHINQVVTEFGLAVGTHISVVFEASALAADSKWASAALHFGVDCPAPAELTQIQKAGIPIIPIVSTLERFADEVPQCLRHINGLALAEVGPKGIVAALLECVGLLPRQRRVFLSYRRTESRDAALQLFEALSARRFDVFLDTHGVPAAEDFQAVLWHRLCDSDVLVMLDTQTYFESRWTAAEFGRALAKDVSILRVGWPDRTPSRRVSMIPSVQLAAANFGPSGDHFTSATLERLAVEVEMLRSKSIAARHLKLAGALRAAVERIGGGVEGIGQRRSIVLRLPDERLVTAYPAVGVPSAETMHDVAEHCGGNRTLGGVAALVYDHVGLHDRWQRHLAWLQEHIRVVRCVRSEEAAWLLADWQEV